MDYFRILNLDGEPFSNSPDPGCFYESRQHVGCLQKLELSMRLRRGLNVVVGEVGTGKTTLCRQLIQRFADDADFETHLVLDPDYPDASAFLAAVADMLCGGGDSAENDWQIKERIKKTLFKKGVEQGKTVVLIIDEGQKIRPAVLEILRELLNYETNTAKLLQIVIFAQTEIQQTLEAHANLADRIDLFHRLGPLGFRDTRNLIRFRLARAGARDHGRTLFSLPALWAVYRLTRGFPRKIIHLCHKAMLAMIIQNRSRAGWALVHACARHSFGPRKSSPARRWIWLALAGSLAAVGLAGYGPELVGPVERPVVKVKSGPSKKAPGPSEETNALLERRARETASALSPTTGAAPAVSGKETRSDVQLANETVATDRDETLAQDRDPGPPSVLGTATLEENEVLSWLMIKFYGRFSPGLLDQVARANPRISDLDNIAVGDDIRLPALAAPIGRRHRSGCWIEVAHTRELARAMDFLRHYPREAPAARVVPYWRPDDGLHFSVLLWPCFSDDAAAMGQQAALPAALASGSRLIHRWDDRAVFFSDPYRVR